MKAIKKRKKLLIWLTLLALVLAGVGWWWATKPRALRLTLLLEGEQHYLRCHADAGFLTGTTTQYRFRDWRGRLLWQITPPATDENDQLALSPNGRCLARWIEEGKTPRFMVWRDGTLISRTPVPRVFLLTKPGQPLPPSRISVSNTGVIIAAAAHNSSAWVIRVEQNTMLRGSCPVPSSLFDVNGKPEVFISPDQRTLALVGPSEWMPIEVKTSTSGLLLMPRSMQTRYIREVRPSGHLIDDAGIQYRMADGKMLPGRYQPTGYAVFGNTLMYVGVNGTAQYRPAVALGLLRGKSRRFCQWTIEHVPPTARLLGGLTDTLYLSVADTNGHLYATVPTCYGSEELAFAPVVLPEWETFASLRAFDEMSFQERDCLISPDGHTLVSGFFCYKKGHPAIGGLAVFRW